MYLLIKRNLMEATGRVSQCVRRVGLSAVEALARRPRGHQLLRQVDRVLDVTERLARWAAGGDGTSHSTYFPVSMLTMVPLTVLVLPSVVLGVIIISVPILPLVLPMFVFGPIVNLCYDGTISTFLACFPTASSIATTIRRRRRELRAIRYNGVRDMHFYDKVGKSDSILLKIFIWWPVAVLAIMGQLIGLGGPNTPATRTLSPLQKGDLEESPRKRKLYELEIVSNEEKKSDTEIEEIEIIDSEVEECSEVEETLDPLETGIMEIISRTVRELDANVKVDGSTDVDDPDYEPEEYVSDDSDTEDAGDEGDEDEKHDFEDEKGSEGEVLTHEKVDSVKPDDKKDKTDIPTQTLKLEDSIPKIVIEDESGDVAAPQKDEDPRGDNEDSPTNTDYSTPKSGSDEETDRPKNIAEEMILFLDAEAATSSNLVSEGKPIENLSADSPTSKNLPDSAHSEEPDSLEGKDGAKSKPLFGGIFRRKSNDKQN